jgi:hypothetical protein
MTITEMTGEEDGEGKMMEGEEDREGRGSMPACMDRNKREE